jgi:hypothetical protein
MALRIITASERVQEQGGVKALILGPYGIGKTSLLRTLDPATTLFVDGESGDLAVQDVPVDTMRPTTWPECRNLACFLGGPNPAFPAEATYGPAHYEAMVEEFGDPGALDKYHTVFVDSLTKVSRLALQWAQQQPEAFNAQGKPDLRSAYGLLGREVVSWATQLQHIRGKNVVMTCAMEQTKDDFGRLTWDPHIEGSKAGRELPGIVDEVISYTLVDFGDGDVQRAFVTQKDNPFGLPAKDRSGRLEAVEEPHLGKLIAKASDSERRRADLTTTIRPHASAQGRESQGREPQAA